MKNLKSPVQSPISSPIKSKGGINTPSVAPTGLAATAHASTIALTWNAVGGAAFYSIYRSTSSGTEVSYDTSATNSYEDDFATQQQIYYYKVGAGAGPLSSEVNATITPDTMIAAVPNKLVWYRAEAQSGVGEAGDITSLLDQSGNGNNSGDRVSVNRYGKYAASGTNGKPSINFNDPQAYAGPSVYPTGSVSTFGVADAQSYSGQQFCFWGSNFSSTDHSFRFTSATNLRYRYTAGSGPDFTVPSQADNVPVCMVSTHDSSLGLVNVYLNGVWKGQSSVATGGVGSTTRVYGNFGTSSGTGYVNDTILKSATFTPEELATLMQAAALKWAYGSQGKSLISLDGASNMADPNFYQGFLNGITGEIYSGGGHNYTQMDWQLIAQNAATLAGRLAAQVTDMFPFYTGLAPRNMVVWYGGGNDISSGATTATMLANFASYYQFAKNVGFKVVVFDIIDRAFVTPDQATGDATRLAVNAALANAAPGVYWDLFVPLAGGANPSSSPNWGPVGARLNTTYYEVDAVHPNHPTGTDSVKAIVGPYVQTYWNKLKNFQIT